MQFNFDVQQALGRVSSKVVANGSIFVVNGQHLKGNQVEQVRQIVDSMGHASGKAQKLPSTITTLGKLQANEHIIFIKAEQNKCIGFLKVGYKKLFVAGRGGEMHEMKPLSVLDFFVDASVQRGGFGRALFDIMLSHMNSQPSQIAYDRPSHKLMGFLAKHFKLQNYVQQNNNYVVFDDYFQQQGQPKVGSNKLQGRNSEVAMTETVRQSTNYDNSNSVFGSSHMTSFQKAAQPSQSHHQTLSGGWGPVKADQDATMSQQRTHYPRQSHHNQQFRIGDGSNEKQGEVSPSQNAHIRTQAHTFGHNSNSIASNGSQSFQQTHSSNGFGSTFMSSNNIRQGQHQQQQQSTAMKFGNVGQELISKPGGANNPAGGLLDRSKAQATLNDFKQSFTQLSSLQRHKQNDSISGGGGVGPSQHGTHPDPTQMFQTSYQSQFVQSHGGEVRKTDPRQNDQNNASAKFGQYGYSPFQAFANRQQSLPSPQQQQAIQQPQPSQGNHHHQYGQQQTSRVSEFRTVNAKSNLQPKNYMASFSGNFQDAMTETSQAKALSMPATQRMLNHRATRDSQSQFASVAARPYNQSGNHVSSYSYSAGHALSPATGGSKAAQFMQHQQQFQPSKGPLPSSVWQSQDGGAYRNSQHFSRGSGLRNF